MAEIEADRAERAEARAERYEERAEKRGDEANADYAKARQMAEAIPFGQPMMPDHYSYNRDRNYRAKIERTYGRAFEGMDEAEELARRAEAAEANQSHRESVPATLRRIEKLEAELRGVQRDLDGRLEYVPDEAGGYTLKRVMPSEGRKARLEQMAADLQEQIDYWRGHVAEAEANGVKVWSKADFAKGDFALIRWGWVEVLRVNAKSLTHPWGANAVHLEVVTRDNVKTALGTPGWTGTVTYDEVRGRKSAEEMAEILAKAGRSGLTRWPRCNRPKAEGGRAVARRGVVRQENKQRGATDMTSNGRPVHKRDVSVQDGELTRCGLFASGLEGRISDEADSVTCWDCLTEGPAVAYVILPGGQVIERRSAALDGYPFAVAVGKLGGEWRLRYWADSADEAQFLAKGVHGRIPRVQFAGKAVAAS